MCCGADGLTTAQANCDQTEAGLSRDRPDRPGSSPDLPRPGSREELRQRLERLPPSHPSSPRYKDGQARQPQLRVPEASAAAAAAETAGQSTRPATRPDSRPSPG